MENGTSPTNPNLSDTSKPPQKRVIDRNMVLDTIRAKAPISIWHLREILQIGYSTLWNIIRELEFVHLIETREISNEKNRNERVITIIGGKNDG